jgi:D-alanyl-D-alanine carboxypeptidase (penicillin-binding protein 5/6)
MRSTSSSLPILVAVAILLVALGGYRYTRPLPPLQITHLLPETSTPQPGQPNLPLPTRGAAGVAVEGLGIVQLVGDERPRPIASVTKMMTAYVLLKNRPLKLGEAGPVITTTAADIQLYRRLIAQDESVVAVAEGTRMSQYDMMQALLIPSGNNIGAMLATWESGSVDAFIVKMNAEAKALGMTNTRYVDASGVSKESQSTAKDQLILAQALMANPVFAEIVAKKQATVPVAGTIFSTDTLLGKNGIVGVKTGWTEEAGGNFVGAAKVNVQGRTLTVFSAVLGQDTLETAFRVTENLLPAAGAQLKFVKVLPAGEPVAEVDTGWDKSTRILADGEVELLTWPGMPVRIGVALNPLEVPIKSGADVGGVKVMAGEQTRELRLHAESELPAPTRWWRIRRS